MCRQWEEAEQGVAGRPKPRAHVAPPSKENGVPLLSFLVVFVQGIRNFDLPCGYATSLSLVEKKRCYVSTSSLSWLQCLLNFGHHFF